MGACACVCVRALLYSYQLFGESRRSCLADGLWDGQDPVCEGMRPFFSKLHSSPSAPNVARLTFLQAFSPLLWAAFSLSLAVKCGRPPSIENGQLESPPEEQYDHGSVVRYVCNEDYTLFGEHDSICKNGDWTEAPRCKSMFVTSFIASYIPWSAGYLYSILPFSWYMESRILNLPSFSDQSCVCYCLCSWGWITSSTEVVL